MADKEIIEKLTGLIFHNVRISGLAGEGDEFVVLRGTYLIENKEVVIHLYQSNPMFLLNEVDFVLLPRSFDLNQREERFFAIADKLMESCERPNPGLFFWHLKFVYTRILASLCFSFDQYQMPILDTTTHNLQNSELIALGEQTLNRERELEFLVVN
jgi:hypothetical protein